MTTLDVKLLAEVYDIAQTYGKDVVFYVPASSSYDAATGIVTEGTVTQYTVKVTPPESYSNSMIDGDLIQAQDLTILLPAKSLSFTPALTMKVTFDSESFDIVSISPLYSGANICGYTIQLRQ